ncbi:hypothetical protein IW140_003438 [Coemansia sp. RSA 1813]|nr:hypothetical protein EV178_006118 [Coemansia sp. RSA 1646]KAJ1768567.1 hypothetical protein LPJ74_004767 [Coemansia sp. RSA 1843]KAJ2085798.1 hypothetical protein IW138_006109 [Coemansia sp. RSA 986]KAJ2210668.1 hypothetical protein EV179_006074 [Coemansia sp. RSA 487]KAJ2568932.1 hypothetical protein IW140_003438 [Coemansia sp. RSA 1813]
MKLAAALLALAAVAVAQDSSSSLSALEQCYKQKCPNGVTNACQAACLNNPNPNASMIAETNKCYEGCNGLDYQGAIDCQAKCNELYNPSGVVVTDHLTPAGVSEDGSTSTSASSGASTAAESQDAKSQDAESNSDDEKSSGKESGSDAEKSGDEKNSDTESSGASSVKVVLSAVAAVAAAAALF